MSELVLETQREEAHITQKHQQNGSHTSSENPQVIVLHTLDVIVSHWLPLKRNSETSFLRD